MHKKGAASIIVTVGLILVALLLIVFLPRMVELGNDTMTQQNTNDVAVHLGVTTGDQPMAVLTFSNTGTKDAYLDKQMVFVDGKVQSEVLFMTADGKEMPSKVPSAKRATPEKGDMIQVKPGETFKTEAPLNQAFTFLPGVHVYKLQYRASHRDVVENVSRKLASNEVSFSYGASDVTAHLEIAVKDSPVAMLTLINKGTKDVYMEPLMAYGDVFTITTDGKEIPFTLPHLDRNAPLEGDMIQIKVGESFKKEIEFGHVYAFLPGTHTYQIQYRDEYSFDITPTAPEYPLVSNEVGFSYTVAGK